MHVALLASRPWLEQERSTFRHLVVGLMDDRARVAQVVPPGWSDRVSSGFADTIAWEPTSLPLGRRWRHRNLVQAVGNLPIDVVHAMDADRWQAAIELSLQLGAVAVLQFNHTDALALGPTAAAAFDDPTRLAFVAATKPLADAMRHRLPHPESVHYIPPGVHISEPTPAAHFDPATPCMVVTGTGEDDAHYLALLEALASLVNQHRQAQFFFESIRRQQHDLWRRARRLGLLENITLVEPGQGDRQLLLAADLIIQPQPIGGSRSFLLRAMAQQRAVLACQDPWVDYLLDNQTAWVVPGSDRAAWMRLLQRALESPDEARALGTSARQWVAANARASTLVSATIELYNALLGESIPFPS